MKPSELLTYILDTLNESVPDWQDSNFPKDVEASRLLLGLAKTLSTPRTYQAVAELIEDTGNRAWEPVPDELRKLANVLDGR